MAIGNGMVRSLYKNSGLLTPESAKWKHQTNLV